MAEDEKLTPIVKATLKEKGVIQKAADLFLTEDIKSAKEYAKKEVIKGIKKNILNIAARFLDTDGTTDYATKSYNTGSTINYRDYAAALQGRKSAEATPYKRTRYEDPIIPTQDMAVAVRDKLFDILKACGKVRISDLYELCGVETTWCDPTYGWTGEIADSKILMYRGQYVLKMPEPKPLR